MLNIMVCFTDFRADMGATRILPRSHRREAPRLGLDREGRVAALEDLGGMVPAEADAGSAILWEGRTWHCQAASTSGCVRLSVGHTFAFHFVKPQELYATSLHDEVYASLGDDELRVLGFEVAQEYAGRIGPRHEGDMRRNTNRSTPFIPELRRGWAPWRDATGMPVGACL